MNHLGRSSWILGSAVLLLSCQGIIEGPPQTTPPETAGSTGVVAGTGGSGGTLGGTSGAHTGGSAPGGTGGTAAGGAPPLGTGPLCDVLELMRDKCQSCHSIPPARRVPMSLASYEDLVAPSPNEPTLSVAQASLGRMQDPTAPMPPAPATPATTADVAVLQAWLDAGMPSSCEQGAGGEGGGGSVAPNPYDTPTVCTSDQRWTGGDEESPNMHPGGACIQCHTSEGEEEGPRFTFAGTVFPTAHEPTDCNGLDGTADRAEVVIIDANGTSLTLKVNSVGNFSYTARGTSIALPYQAKVVVAGRERVMSEKQENGDCNTCHTENGAKDAPGRIMAP